MARRVWPFLRLTLKVTVAGGAVLLALDQQLLGPGSSSEDALHRARAALPVAADWLRRELGQRGLQAPQLPPLPEFDFNVRDGWNAGVLMTMSALSAAPAKACQLTRGGWDYVRGLLAK